MDTMVAHPSTSDPRTEANWLREATSNAKSEVDMHGPHSQYAKDSVEKHLLPSHGYLCTWGDANKRHH